MSGTSYKAKRKKYVYKTKKRHRPSKKAIRISIPVAMAIVASIFLIMIKPIFGGKEIDRADNDGKNGNITGAAVPMGDYKFGFDISHYNSSDIKWNDLKVLVDKKGRTVKSLKKAKDIYPVSFVVMKATEGTTLKDNKFKKWWNEAGETDIPRGAYHFFRSSKDPETQADFFISAVGRLKSNDLPPILDLEIKHVGCSKNTLNARVLTWLRLVGRYYGQKPIIYTSTDFINLYLTPEITENYQIWISDFRDRDPVISNWYIWQFTDKAVVYGVPGHVDLNVMKIK